MVKQQNIIIFSHAECILQAMMGYQPTLDTLELKKTEALFMFLNGNQKEYITLNLSHYILLSCIA